METMDNATAERMRAMNPSDLEEQKQLTELYALAAGVGK